MVIRTKRARWVSVILSVMMVFAFMPFLSTQEAHAVALGGDDGMVTIDLTSKEKKLYGDAEAAAIYCIIKEGIDNGTIGTHTWTNDETTLDMDLDLNNDGKYDMGFTAGFGIDEVASLKLWRLDGFSQFGKYRFSLDNSTSYYYYDMPYFNDYGLSYYYDTIQLEFPDGYVEIKEPDTLTIPLVLEQYTTYAGVEAAAIEALVMDDAAQTKDGNILIENYTVHDDFTSCTFCLDRDDDPDLYGTFFYNDSGVCERCSFYLASNYYDYDAIRVYLPEERINYYASMTVPNEQGLEYMYKSLVFDTRTPIDGMTVELSKKSFTYNGKVQKPDIVKIGEPELAEGTDYAVEWSDPSSKNAGTYTVTITGKGTYRGTITTTYKINKIAQTVTAAKASYTKAFGNAAFNLKVKTNGDGKLKYSSNNVKVATVSNAGKVTIKGVGTAKIKVFAAEGTNYIKSASKTVTVKVNKGKNPLAVTGKTATVKYSKVKNADKKLTVSKVLKTTKKGQGTVTYTKSKGNKKITIAKKTGKVTVKKGLKKGTYTVKVKIKAAGTKNYKALTKTVTFKIKVK